LKIVDIQLALLAKRLEERKIGLQVTPRAKTLLAEAGFDPQFGARPLKRTIQNMVQNPLARQVLAGEVTDGSTVIIDVGKDGIAFRKK
jgi:ATP-dependent Clp protease ATP-binding subunit ClpB